MRGQGSVYRQKGSRFWWIQYHRNGRPYRQSSNSDKKRVAEKLLQKKLGEIAIHNFIDPTCDRILIRDLAESLIRDYTINGRKSLIDLKSRWKVHLGPYFGEIRAAYLSPDSVSLYVAQRQSDQAANATINRELAALKRMYTIAIQSRKLVNRPYIPQLKESNARKGFLKDAQYHTLATETGKIGLWLRGMFELGYTYGWRKSELLEMRVRQVDLEERSITLDAGETKNDDARLVEMTEKVFELLRECVAGKSAEDYVFTRTVDRRGRRVRTRTADLLPGTEPGGESAGGRIVDFRDDWTDACKAAGCPGLLFHDLRRSGVRNLIRSGVREKSAMQITGHKTRSVFERYNIVDQQDMHDAVKKLEVAARRRRQIGIFEETGQLFGDITDPVERKPQ